MISKTLLSICCIFSFVVSQAQAKLVNGMKLKTTTKFKTAIYKLNAPSGNNKAVITIQGDNIIIDFANSTLQGSETGNRSDEFKGIAVLVSNSKNVTIRNLKARGYKIALLARNVTGLVLDHCDLSYNYRPHLNSTQEKEDLSDWMSYHHNENDEWLRYGAAIYLSGCNAAVVKNCFVTGGQNALMMTKCNNSKIYENDFSFNSGIGIGMYRSCNNEISFNKINFNVRGYSHGVYNRGQDSAGILVYEQSNDNIFYKNSVTHGGDGFFLWAGQTTMDTGLGGCNDNVIWENDFSFAPTNGVEVTFSRNRIEGNRIFECDHGIWGGYSYNSKITHNQFRENRVGIAIEHGQHNEISYNLFSKDKQAIKLWGSKPSDPVDNNWGYAKYRDTRSFDYTIAANSFNSNPLAISMATTDTLYMFGNTFSDHEIIFQKDSALMFTDLFEKDLADTSMNYPNYAHGNDPFKGNGKLAGRKNILMTEWGPYDFRSPIIWNTNPVEKSDTLKFKLLGPAGSWKLIGSKGVTGVSKSSGSFPDSIVALKEKSNTTDIQIEVEYKGSEITNPFGIKIPAATPYRFYFKKYFQPMEWQVLFYSLDTLSNNPIKTGVLFSPLERKAPFKTEKPDRIEYAWWGGIKGPGGQHKQFITVAETTATFDPGEYELGVTWDDAVRVYVDENLVLNEWNPSLYSFDESPHKSVRLMLSGRHNLRVEHIELGGFATLSLKIKPVR